MTGARMIAIERKRQVEEEGWDKEHDSQHTNGELAQAAAAYATPPKGGSGYFQDERIALFPNEWDAKWWKPCPDDRIRELVKAGALIAAEIDRLQRAAVRGKE